MNNEMVWLCQELLCGIAFLSGECSVIKMKKCSEPVCLEQYYHDMGRKGNIQKNNRK